MYASIYTYIYVYIFSRWLGVFLLGLLEDGGLEVGVFTPLGRSFSTVEVINHLDTCVFLHMKFMRKCALLC